VKNIDMAAVARVSGRVELVSIRLTRINATANKSVESGVPLEPTFEHECAAVAVENGLIDVVCSYKFKVRASDAEAAEAEVSYNVLYRLLGDQPVADTDLAQFASANGAYHSWPFVRETIYGLTSRMGFPPYTLPVLSFVGKASEPPENVSKENPVPSDSLAPSSGS
jgi:preprotein translocase subunit SecB